MDIGRLATACLVAAVTVAGCSSSSAPTTASPAQLSEPQLDGTYRVEIDGRRTLRDGAPNPDASTSLTWAFRSSCDSTCIAVAVPVNDEDPPQIGEPAVWDYVSGGWVKTVTGALECGGAPTPTLETWALRPAAGDTLTGIRHLAFFGTGCGSILEQSVTLTRTGDVKAPVTIPDPTSQAALKPSVGAGLRGRYNKIQTRQGGEAMPVIALDVTTNCVRNTEHCLTYTVYDPPEKPLRRVAGYQLLDGRWSSAVPYDKTCPDGSAVRVTLETQWLLPEPPADPIPRLAGTQRDVYPEPCMNAVESQLVLARIGD